MALYATGGSTRANFGDLLEPGFRTIFFDQFAQLPTVYDKVFKVNASGKQQEYDSSVSGFGQLVETVEGGPVTYEDPICKRVAHILRICEKFFKLLETLVMSLVGFILTIQRIETISIQATATKKAVEGSTTIIRTPFGEMV